MKLISLNVARPQLMVYNGATISTGIFKKPVSGRVMLRRLNLDGDRQADLSVHGGLNKAVYAYPAEHYEYWQHELAGKDLPWGMFGENFTTSDLGEEDLHIGDRLRMGAATVVVRQPRMPCYKLQAKFQIDDMIQRFLRSGRSGFYFSVEEEGEVEAGDSIEVLSHDQDGISIAKLNRLFFHEKYNSNLLQKAIATAALPEDWREYLLPRLNGPAESA